MLDIPHAQKLLTENFAPWVLDLAPTITALGPDGAALEIPITDRIARVGGLVCGQAVSALADTTMVFACAGHLGDFVPVATTNLETRFLAAARGTSMLCTARVIRAGRALIFAEAHLVSLPDNRLVAAASATFFKP